MVALVLQEKKEEDERKRNIKQPSGSRFVIVFSVRREERGSPCSSGVEETVGSSRFYSAFSAGNRFGVSKIFHVAGEAGSSPRFSTPAPPGCFALALTWVVRLPINIMSRKASVAGRTDCACAAGPGDPGLSCPRHSCFWALL